MGQDGFTRDMFGWLQRVADDRAVGDLGARVAMILVRYFNRRTGDAWPSQDTLAALVGKSDRSVRTALEQLAAAGHIEVERAGARRVNRYRIRLSGPEEDFLSDIAMTGSQLPLETTDERQYTSDHVVGDRKQTSAHMCGDRKYTSAMTGSQLPPNLLNEPLERKREESLSLSLIGDEVVDSQPTTKPARRHGTAAPTAAELAAFEAWWLLYPRKKSKGAALVAFPKVLRDGAATIEELMYGVAAYAREREGQDPQYTKHPATWLNQACWRDAPDQAFARPPPHTAYRPRSGPGSWSGLDQAIEGIESIFGEDA